MAKRWVLRALLVKDISYGHTPDKRGERTDKWGKPPIHVKPRGGGYRVHDGNDRLYYARRRGDTRINAYVLVDALDEPVRASVRSSVSACTGSRRDDQQIGEDELTMATEEKRTAHKVTDSRGNTFIAMSGAELYENRDDYQVVPVEGYARTYGFEVTDEKD